MKKESKQQLKAVILQCMSQYFEQSGINKILLELYESSQNVGMVASPPSNKVQNILDTNAKTTSRVAQMKKKYVNQNLASEDEQAQALLPTMGVQGTQLNTALRATLNQNIDPLENGGKSILDLGNSLPDFLVKGLNKIKKNAGN